MNGDALETPHPGSGRWSGRLARVRAALPGWFLRADVLVSLFALYTIYRLLLRYRLGADPTDESFYAALQHRFALGDKPYVDEVNLRQTFSFIPLPFYWLYLKVNHTTDGVIRYLRLVYFLFTCTTAWFVYRYAKTRVGHAAAVAIGLTAVAFIPFNIPASSYNTLGCTFFTGGIFLSLHRLSRPSPGWTHFVSGFLHGLALIAYPPMAVAVVPFGLACLLLDDGGRRFRNFGLYVAGGVVTVLLMLPLLSAAGPGGIREALAYERALTKPRTMEKLKAVFEILWDLAPVQPRTLAVTVVFVVAARAFGLVRTLLLPCILPGIAWWVNTPPIRGPHETHIIALYFNVYAGMAGVAFLLVRRFDRDSLRFLFCCFLPAAIAGTINAFSSDNPGAVNAGLGAFPAATLALVLATEISSNEARRPKALHFAIAAACAIVYYHVELTYSHVYRDGPAETLKTKIRVGPFRGMYTTEKTAAEFTELTRVLRQHEARGGRVISFYDFPAAYLVNRMRIGMPSSWTDSRIPASPFMLEYYKRHLTGRGLVVRWPVANWNGRTALDVLVEDPSRVLFRGANGWVLYREPPPAP